MVLTDKQLKAEKGGRVKLERKKENKEGSKVKKEKCVGGQV